MTKIMFDGRNEFGEFLGEWEEIELPQEELDAKVASGEWYHCTECDHNGYDDGLPSYHPRVVSGR